MTLQVATPRIVGVPLDRVPSDTLRLVEAAQVDEVPREVPGALRDARGFWKTFVETLDQMDGSLGIGELEPTELFQEGAFLLLQRADRGGGSLLFGGVARVDCSGYRGLLGG